MSCSVDMYGKKYTFICWYISMSTVRAYIVACLLFDSYCNKEIVLLEKLEAASDIITVKKLVKNHADFTGSKIAKDIMDNWNAYQDKFVKVIPKDYKKVMGLLEQYRREGMSEYDATLRVFEEVKA